TMADRCPACDAVVLGNEVYCRQCASPLMSHLPPTSRRLRWMVHARRFVLINSILSLVPTMLMCAPRSALVGGPILIVLGLAVVWVGRRATYPAATKLGSIQAAVALVWMPLVWSLQSARQLVVFTFPLVLIAVIALYVASLWVWHNHPARNLRFQCDHCGYLLSGLPLPRCPECGQPFDPARMN
ncbi:MAG: hypothetical protein HY718_17225, partial [Planctomycetes bacterium]|nr:hypothetical protein [Planctomycetota bacterium]